MDSSRHGQRFNVEADTLMTEAAKAIRETEVVVDIGCGIMPMSYFRPKLHFMIDPWKEYSDILAYRHRKDKSVVILRLGALEAMRAFADRSVDSIFMLDVIEHLPKDEGLAVLKECDRVAREQIVIFTPLGFMPQHMNEGEPDGWGLSGGNVQRHVSGWVPDDFGPNWTFYISEDFHRIDFRGEKLARPHGAFFAIRTLDATDVNFPSAWSDVRRPLPSEIRATVLEAENKILREKLEKLSARGPVSTTRRR